MADAKRSRTDTENACACRAPAVRLPCSALDHAVFARMPNMESNRAKKIRMRKEQERDAAVGAIWHLATLPENRE